MFLVVAVGLHQGALRFSEGELAISTTVVPSLDPACQTILLVEPLDKL